MAFTRLFRQRRKNHQKICLGLQLIAAGVARTFRPPTEDDRDELQANALLAAIERIDRFKFNRGADAFTYYTSLIFNSFVRQAGRESRRQGRVSLFTDIGPRDGDWCREDYRIYGSQNFIENGKPYTHVA